MPPPNGPPGQDGKQNKVVQIVCYMNGLMPVWLALTESGDIWRTVPEHQDEWEYVQGPPLNR